MKGKAAPLLASFLVSLPTGAYALGLGNIQLSSALNEPLHARIPLLSLEKGDLQDLKVSLGTSTQFTRAGLERPFVLSKLRFKVEKGPHGRPYISVTTRGPIAEPFLDFLLEVDWPQGRVVREYTVLLDPPVYGSAMQRSVRPAVSTRQPSSSSRSAAGDTVAHASGAGEAPAAAASGRQTESSAGPAAQSYGPVKTTDTLWSLASRYRPDGRVSVQQMMLAMVRANPDAFVDGNVNGLKAGAVLRIPELRNIESLSQEEALAEVKRQYAAWAQERPAPTPQAAQAPSKAPEGASVPSTKTPAARPDDPAAGGGSSDQNGKLEVLAAGSQEDGTGSASPQTTLAELRNKLKLAQEQIDSQKREKEELSSRLQQTEALVKDLKRLVDLKDQSLAVLQQKLAAQQSGAEGQKKEVAPAVAAAVGAAQQPPSNGAGGGEGSQGPAGAGNGVSSPSSAAQPGASATGQSGPEPASAMPPGAATPGQPHPEPPSAAQSKSPAASQASTQSTSPAEAATDQPAQQKATQETPPATGAAIAKPPAAPVSKSPSKQPSKSPSSFLDSVLQSLPVSPVALGAGIGVLLLAIGGILLGRRRRAADEADAEAQLSQLEPGVESGDGEDALAMAAADSAAVAEETEQHRDQEQAEEVDLPPEPAAESDPEQIAVSELEPEEDPLAEVNVYLAYERFDQAEELVREAIARYPERPDYRLKLVEVAYAAKAPALFEASAQELQDVAGEHSPLMEKVHAWWQELSPERELFAPPPAQVPTPADEFEATRADAHAADDIFDVTGRQDEAAASAADTGVDFDLGFDDEAPEERSDQGNALDFDLGFEADEGSGAAAGEASMDAADSPVEEAHDGAGTTTVEALTENEAAGGEPEGERTHVEAGLDFGLGWDEQVDEEGSEEGDAQANDTLDFELELDEEATASLQAARVEPQGVDQESEASTEHDALDFDLSESQADSLDSEGAEGLGEDLELARAEVGIEAPAAQGEDTGSALDFDIDEDLSTAAFAADDQQAATPDTDTGTWLDFVLDEEEPQAAAAAEAQAQPAGDTDASETRSMAEGEPGEEMPEVTSQELDVASLSPPDLDLDLSLDDSAEKTSESAETPTLESESEQVESDELRSEELRGTGTAGAGPHGTRHRYVDEVSRARARRLAETTTEGASTVVQVGPSSAELAQGYAAPERDAESGVDLDLSADDDETADTVAATSLDLDISGFAEADAAPAAEPFASEPAEPVHEEGAAVASEGPDTSPTPDVATEQDQAERTQFSLRDVTGPSRFEMGTEDGVQADDQTVPLDKRHAAVEVDDIQTKLDLALAYIDMGDADGARGILGEVMDEGNEAQKEAARELLGKLE